MQAQIASLNSLITNLSESKKHEYSLLNHQIEEWKKQDSGYQWSSPSHVMGSVRAHG